MAVKRKYRLNLRNYGNLPAIMLSQYDEGYALEFEIRDGTDAASDLSAYTVTLKGTRADTLAYSFAGTISTNVLTFVIDTTMTACAGRGTAEIAIKDTANDVLFATFNMPVFVERAAVPEGSIDADVERAQEIAEEVEELIDGATEGAEAWAVGQRGGVDVESTDETYHNNAKYYAEQAADSAASIGIDATLTQAGKAADAKKTGDEITDLKEGLNEIASVKTPEETEADLYISDSNGNVLAEFADGHIKTKNFDSSDIDLGNSAKIATTNAQTDLDIADANGYVAVRIKDGAIITPNFNTDNAVDSAEVSEIVAEEFPNKYLEKYRLNGIKWDALGDSLTDPATVGLNNKNYTRWISEANGINLNNLGVGGKGYWQGIEDEVANIRSDTDIVTIFGSLNDINNYIANPGVPTDTWADGKTNYCARARRVFDAILAVRNDIRIGVILPTPWVNYNCYDTATATQENVENMLDALKGICKIYGIPVLDMYHGSNLRPWDSDFRDTYYVASDGYHPNELGNKLFVAPQIEAFLRSLAISY